MTSWEFIHPAYNEEPHPRCDWGWCAADATEGCVQRYEHGDAAEPRVTLSVTPYCAEHAALNRVCIASVARGGG